MTLEVNATPGVRANTSEPGHRARLERAVWARLAAGALVSGACAWSVVMLPPVQDALFIMQSGEAAAVRPLGLAVMLAAPVLWILARLLLRAPVFGAGAIFYWAYVAVLGFAANAIFFFALGDSLVSVFALAVLGFAALNMLARVVRAPTMLATGVFLIVGLGGAYLADRVLTTTWPFLAVDLIGVTIYALFALRAADARNDLDALAEKRGWTTLVNFGALHALALVRAMHAPSASGAERVASVAPARKEEAPAPAPHTERAA